VIALALGANVGAASYFAEDALDLRIIQPLLTGALALLLFAVIYSLIKMYAAIADDPVLSPSERQRYRRNILLVGPLAAVEMVLNLGPSRSDRG
jgi:hypothetical protein